MEWVCLYIYPLIAKPVLNLTTAIEKLPLRQFSTKGGGGGAVCVVQCDSWHSKPIGGRYSIRAGFYIGQQTNHKKAMGYPRVRGTRSRCIY